MLATAFPGPHVSVSSFVEVVRTSLMAAAFPAIGSGAGGGVGGGGGCLGYRADYTKSVCFLCCMGSDCWATGATVDGAG